MENFSLVDFFKLKDNFIKYVAEKEPEENKVEKEIDIEENFFRYASEFEKFAAKELKLTENSFSENFDKLNSIENVTELLELINQEEEALNNTSLEDVENAEVEEPQATTEEETVVNEDVSTAEGEESENTQEETETNLLNATIVEMFKNEEFKNLVDTNSDGKIDEEELLAMFNSAIGLDDNKENLSLNDLTQAMTKVNEGEFKIESTSSKEENIAPVQTPTTPVQNNTTNSNIQSGNYLKTTLKNKNYGGQNSQPKEPSLEEMNSTQLKSEISKREDILNEKKANLTAIQEGTDKEISSLEIAAQNSFNILVETIESELGPETAETYKKLEENKTKISNNELTITNLQNSITEFECSINCLTSTASACDTQANTLSNKIAELENSKNNKSEEEKRKIDNQINRLALKREKALNEKKTYEEQIKVLNEQKEATLTEIEILNKENEALKEENTVFEAQIATLEQAIANGNKNLEDAKAKYEADKSALETLKESKIATAQAEINAATKAVNEAKEMLAKTLEKEAKIKYSTNDGMSVVEWARQYDDKNQNYMLNEFSNFHRNAWCADFVSQGYSEVLGDENLPEWYNNITNKAYCPNIQQAGKGHEVALEEAQAGDLVLYDWDGDGSADHVGIFIENTEEGKFMAIEGNTSNRTTGAGSSVEEKERKESQIIGIYSMNA